MLALDGDATVFPFMMVAGLIPEVGRCNGPYQHTWCAQGTCSSGVCATDGTHGADGA
jgi:hypothetical protein